MKPTLGNKIRTIGVMSGTSLDGLDIAAVEFNLEDDRWSFQLLAAETCSYPENWIKKLELSPTLSGEKLTELHSEYGKFIGEQTLFFIKKTHFAPDLIASHGHTIFHQPGKGYTLQIGSGAEIAALTNTLTIADFRSGDVALGGQGAPLVPIGDRLLFSNYMYCLNLGGFANISFEQEGKRLAFDNCPVNFVINHFARKVGLPFDNNGELGKKGKINIKLLDQLNQLPYYRSAAPKSLGREWVEKTFFPILNQSIISDTDKLRTVYEHIALQITKDLSGDGNILITGGGAFNSFLIERIQSLTPCEIVIPTREIIEFKEAIIFAFLGVLRSKNINNCLASVTGAHRDNCGGIIYTT